MKKRLTLLIVLVFVPALLLAADYMADSSFRMAIRAEAERAQAAQALLFRQIKKETEHLSYTGLWQTAVRYREQFREQGLRLAFLYNGVPLAGFTLPNDQYQKLLTGGRTAMLNTVTKPETYAIMEPISEKASLLYMHDVSPVYALRSDMRRAFLSIAIPGALMLALLAYALAAHFTRPIDTLRRAAEALARGEQGAPLPTSRKDEVGALAATFETMRGAVDTRECSLREEIGSRQRLLDALAHEMRTPLCALLGYTRLLQDDRLTGDKRQAVAVKMAQSIERLTHMDEQLTKLCLAGRQGIEQTPVDLYALLKDSADRLQTANEGGSIRVTGKRHIVAGDKALLSLMADNLITNALRASRQGEQIEAHAFPTGFYVRDHGAGMSKEALARAAEPFYKADTSRSSPGIGLGLSLCQKVAALHGGRLLLASRQGKGTIALFTVSLQHGDDCETAPALSCGQEVNIP